MGVPQGGHASCHDPFAVCRLPFAGAGARSTVPLLACCSCRAHPPQGGLSLSLDVPLASQRPGNKVRPAGWGRTAPPSLSRDVPLASQRPGNKVRPAGWGRNAPSRPSNAMSLWRASALATKTKKATSLSQPHRRAPGACFPGVAPFAGSPRVTEHAHAASSHCRSLNARGAPLVWR